MKKILMTLLLAGVTMLAHAEELEDFSFPVKFKGAEPTIADFVTAICSREAPGEWISYMGADWERSRKGKPTKGKFTVNRRKGYMTYVEDDDADGQVHKGVTEFRCWRCADEHLRMVAETDNFYRDGVAYYGQYTGVSLFLYYADYKRMEMVYNSDYGLDGPEINALFVYSLTPSGIVGVAEKPEGGIYRVEYVWNGTKFVKK